MRLQHIQELYFHSLHQLLLGTIQLGATIDYAILITNKYITFRKRPER